MKETDPDALTRYWLPHVQRALDGKMLPGDPTMLPVSVALASYEHYLSQGGDLEANIMRVREAAALFPVLLRYLPKEIGD